MPPGQGRARLIDISRLVSRAGMRPTGVDRVEAAYVRAFLADSVPAYGLYRSPVGFVLTGAAGLSALIAAMESGDWGRPDLLSRLGRGLRPEQRGAQALIRRHRIARGPRNAVAGLLARHLPPGTTYYNTGHSNLDPRVFAAVHAIEGGRCVVLVHDTIPLDLPQFQRAGTVETFARKIRVVAQRADLVIVSSYAAGADIARHLQAAGRLPEMIRAPLGLDMTAPGDLPAGFSRTGPPWFVALGTIEPRKNIGMLLDIWDRIGQGPEAPRLLLVGRRGWRNEEVFARLDRGVPGVTELSGLADPQVSALIAGAQALLFPSMAEGYGLPPLEAAALGTLPVCADLPVCRELLRDGALYLGANDPQAWEETILRLAAQDKRSVDYDAPGWNDHFATVLGLT